MVISERVRQLNKVQSLHIFTFLEEKLTVQTGKNLSPRTLQRKLWLYEELFHVFSSKFKEDASNTTVASNKYGQINNT